jgi:hypothetical protein
VKKARPDWAGWTVWRFAALYQSATTAKQRRVLNAWLALPADVYESYIQKGLIEPMPIGWRLPYKTRNLWNAAADQWEIEQKLSEWWEETNDEAP